MSCDESLWFLNTHITLRRRSDASADGVAIAEHHLPHGDSPPLHVHHREDEIFHVLEGVVRFRVGEQEVVAGPGHSLVGPKGVPHSFRVESPNGARMLTLTPGPDFEGLICDVSRPAGSASLPDPITPTPEMAAAIAEAAERRNITILGPPLEG
jgi:mannose-6-phosphate isomerase-like protein (cupin superfamily)